MTNEPKTFHSANSQARLIVRRRFDHGDGLNLLVDHGHQKLGISLSAGSVRDLINGLGNFTRVPTSAEAYAALSNGDIFTVSSNPSVRYVRLGRYKFAALGSGHVFDTETIPLNAILTKE